MTDGRNASTGYDKDIAQFDKRNEEISSGIQAGISAGKKTLDGAGQMVQGAGEAVADGAETLGKNVTDGLSSAGDAIAKGVDDAWQGSLGQYVVGGLKKLGRTMEEASSENARHTAETVDKASRKMADAPEATSDGSPDLELG